VLPILEELGIGFVPYSPLGKGSYGKMNENTNLIVPTSATLFLALRRGSESESGLVDLLGKIAERKKATPAHIALTCCSTKSRGLSNPCTTSCATRGEHRSTFCRTYIQRIPRDRKRLLKDQVEGARYPEKTGATDRPLSGRMWAGGRPCLDLCWHPVSGRCACVFAGLDSGPAVS